MDALRTDPSRPARVLEPEPRSVDRARVEAQTDQERQRYAELQVALEAKRAERELAYQNAYTAAWAKLFPGLLPIQGMASPSLPTQRSRRAKLCLSRTTAQRAPPKRSVCKAVTRRSISIWWAAKARMNASVAGLGSGHRSGKGPTSADHPEP